MMSTNNVKPPAPVDYTGVLSELLPQLLEKYGRGRIADLMNECSELLSRTQMCNERMTSPGISEQDLNQAMQEVIAVTGEYYKFLGQIPAGVEEAGIGAYVLEKVTAQNHVEELLPATNTQNRLAQLQIEPGKG